MSLKTFADKVRKLFVRPFDLLALHGVGAEIGVYRGKHAKQLLKRHPKIKKLLLVDPYPEHFYVQEYDTAQARCEAHQKLDGNPRVIFYRTTASAFANLMEVRHEHILLDFCYIDGDHSYEAVKSDIEAMWNLIKKVGIMGGHDFHHTWPGVIRAVTEFTVANKLELHTECGDWWVYRV